MISRFAGELAEPSQLIAAIIAPKELMTGITFAHILASFFYQQIGLISVHLLRK